MTYEATRAMAQELTALVDDVGALNAVTQAQLEHIGDLEIVVANRDATISLLQDQLANVPAEAALNLPGWQLIFEDRFNYNDGPPNPLKWSAYPSTWRDTTKLGMYDPRNITVRDGTMRIRVYTDALMTIHVAAPVPLILGPDKLQWGLQNLTWPDQLYGRYAVTMRVPAPLPGYKIAWLTWPDVGTNTTGEADGTGGNGEIDWPECNLGTSIVRVGGFMHRQGATLGSDQYSCGITLDLRQWHTYVTEWGPTRCSFLVDGIVVGSTTDRIPNTMMHHVLQTETQLSGGAPSPLVDGYVEVRDYAAWKRAA